ncbi:hypothetical protein Sros01_43120 [Streptomyces roseochromogenus]|nr:hypothetical protein Sros01_43120 [Streptomyces roseochromogenus]
MGESVSGSLGGCGAEDVVEEVDTNPAATCAAEASHAAPVATLCRIRDEDRAPDAGR